MKAATQHTPGPWVAGKTQGGGWSVWTEGLYYNILDGSAPGIDAEANATLIAAAPQMLYALEQAYEHLSEMGCDCDCENSPMECPVCACKSAIAAATGKEGA